MPPSLEIQVTREICTMVASSAAEAQHHSTMDIDGSRSTIIAGPAVPLPPPAHCRRSSIPEAPHCAPPAYDAGDAHPPAHSLLDVNALDSDNIDSHRHLPPPPDYTKFVENTRAERCFYYGFLCFPIWIFGFLHFWPSFSRAPLAHPLKETELPCWIDPSTGIPMYSTPSPSSTSLLPDSPSKKTFSWRRSTSSSLSTTSGQSRQSCRILMMNRPNAYGAWRKEERAWALRCGYALTATWAIVVAFIFICVQTGVFGFSFS